MFSATFLAAIAVFLIEREFKQAALWSLAAAAFAWLGLMHAYTLTAAAVREEIIPGFASEAAIGYLAMAAIFAFLALREPTRNRD